MTTYFVTYARVEHRVYQIIVDAENDEQARQEAEEALEDPEFDWEDGDIVHADEFFVNFERVENANS